MSFPASVHRLGNAKAAYSRIATKARKEEEEDDDVGIGGPALAFGQPGAARVEKFRGKWGWSWLGEENERSKLLVRDEAQMLYPPNREAEQGYPELPLSAMTLSASDTIREACDKYAHLGIDELIAPELAALHHDAKAPHRYDPFKGRTLEIVLHPRAVYAKHLMCFASGPVGNHLAVSALVARKTGRSRVDAINQFVAPAEPAVEYPTEILQLCSSPVVSEHRNDYGSTALAVRLHSAIHMLNLAPDGSYTSPKPLCPVKVVPVGCINPFDTGGNRIVDMALEPNSWTKAVLVDECGGIWSWQEVKVEIRERIEKHMTLTQVRGPTRQERDGFFRVAFGSRPDTVVIVSDRNVELLDLTALGSPSTRLLSLQGTGRYFTSIEKTSLQRGALYTALCTTHEVLWIDELKPGPPVLSVKHEYGDGKLRDLDLGFIAAERSGSHLLLSSRSNALVQVFDTNTTPPLKLLSSPYLLPIPVSLGPVGSLLCVSLVNVDSRHRAASRTSRLVGQATDGAIYSMHVETTREVEKRGRPVRTGFNILWPEGWQENSSVSKPRLALDNAVPAGEPDAACTKHKLQDLRWVLIDFREAEEPVATFEPEDLERHLRESEAPFDHYMTPLELAKECSSHEHDAGPLVHVRMRLDDRLGTGMEDLDNLNYAKNVNVVVTQPDRQSASDLHASLQRSFFPPTSSVHRNRTAEQHARDLAVDLAMSTIVLHSEALPTAEYDTGLDKPSTSADDLLTRAGNLTLSEQEPAVYAFRALPPREDAPFVLDEYSAGRSSPAPSSGEQGGPDSKRAAFEDVGMRTLLSDWAIGTDPRTYQWKPWIEPKARDGMEPPLTPVRPRPIRPLPSPRSAQAARFASQPNLPRLGLGLGVGGNSSRPLMSTRYGPPPIATIKPTELYRLTPEHSPAASREGSPVLPSSGLQVPLHAATQVERGVFGGRLETKKKKVKKRAGGF